MANRKSTVLDRVERYLQRRKTSATIREVTAAVGGNYFTVKSHLQRYFVRSRDTRRCKVTGRQAHTWKR